MSQKKINKIKGSTVKPKADPVTTPIIDKEKEPNQEQSPISHFYRIKTQGQYKKKSKEQIVKKGKEAKEQ